MEADSYQVESSPAKAFLVLGALGIIVAAVLAASGNQLGVFPIEAAVTALGFGALALFAVQIMLLMKLDQFRRDTGAETTPFRPLLAVLVIGALIALGFAATNNQLGVFPLAPAVTGLGITFAVLAVITGWLLISLQQAGIVQVFPGEAKERAFVNVPEAEEGQHVLLIEGIGEKYASRLNAHGTITIPQLLRSDSAKLAIQAGVTRDLAEEWQAMGRLMQIKGIGAQYAEILAMAGVHTAEALARSDPDTLLAQIDKIEARRKTRVLKTDIKAGHVRKFVQQARDHVDARA